MHGRDGEPEVNAELSVDALSQLCRIEFEAQQKQMPLALLTDHKLGNCEEIRASYSLFVARESRTAVMLWCILGSLLMVAAPSLTRLSGTRMTGSRGYRGRHCPCSLTWGVIVSVHPGIADLFRNERRCLSLLHKMQQAWQSLAALGLRGRHRGVICLPKTAAGTTARLTNSRHLPSPSPCAGGANFVLGVGYLVVILMTLLRAFGSNAMPLAQGVSPVTCCPSWPIPPGDGRRRSRGLGSYPRSCYSSGRLLALAAVAPPARPSESPRSGSDSPAAPVNGGVHRAEGR